VEFLQRLKVPDKMVVSILSILAAAAHHYLTQKKEKEGDSNKSKTKPSIDQETNS
jgi:hypothetical protein